MATTSEEPKKAPSEMASAEPVAEKSLVSDAFQDDEPEDEGPALDLDVFSQLLEMDDDDSQEFSKSLVYDYISQAETTFVEFDEALANKDLQTLSRKGHFLKGSSAALGLRKVQRSCERMQHYGQLRDGNGKGPVYSEEEALARCEMLISRIRKEQEEAKKTVLDYYNE